MIEVGKTYIIKERDGQLREVYVEKIENDSYIPESDRKVRYTDVGRHPHAMYYGTFLERLKGASV